MKKSTQLGHIARSGMVKMPHFVSSREEETDDFAQVLCNGEIKACIGQLIKKFVSEVITTPLNIANVHIMIDMKW